jgi:hypothetical protein
MDSHMKINEVIKQAAQAIKDADVLLIRAKHHKKSRLLYTIR